MDDKQAQWLSARETRNPFLEIFRDHFDAGDPWGSVIEAHFQICYTLVRHGIKVPEWWGFQLGAFRPQMDDNDPDNEDGDGSLLGWEFDQLLRDGYGKGWHLIRAGNVLARYASMLKLEGKDY